MRIDLLGPRLRVAIPVLSAAALLILFSSAATATGAVGPVRSTLAGTWAGSYSGTYSGRFTLHWTQTGSKLTGWISLSNPKGRYGINGSVTRGNNISFGVVAAGATYTGSVSGKSMSGKYRTPRGGGSWSATKSS